MQVRGLCAVTALPVDYALTTQLVDLAADRRGIAMSGTPWPGTRMAADFETNV